MPTLLRAVQEDLNNPEPYRVLAGRYAHMGRRDDPRETVARLRAITSVLIPDVRYHRNAKPQELLLSGLRLAMSEVN